MIQPIVRSIHPTRRTAERVLICAAGAWNLLNASITLFAFANWFRGESYSLLESQGLLAADLTDVNNVVYVAQIYGFIVALLGVVSIIVASRGMRPATVYAGVQVYLGCVVAFSLLTGDWLALALYSICFAVYLARSSALRRSHSVAGM